MRREDIRVLAHDLLESGHVECDFIEYKCSDQQKDRILKTICAYANNYMNRDIGLLYIGIEEEDGSSGLKAVPKRPITGMDQGRLEPVENGLKELLGLLDPKPVCHFIPDKLDDKHYLVVAVEPAGRPVTTKDKAQNKYGLRPGRYIRVSRDSVLPNFTQEYQLLKRFANVHFSSELNQTATLDDLNYQWMREYLVRIGARQDVRELSKETMARSLGLLSDTDLGRNRVKNFAVLMFADRPADFIPEAYLQIVSDVADDTDRMIEQVFDGPIWIQARMATAWFRNEVQRSYTLRTKKSELHRIVYNYPEVAFEELATNVVLHRDYDNRNGAGIYVYHDKIVFINHNRPEPPVTIADMNESIEFPDRVYLNPEIKEMFHALGLIESYGSGIRRAKAELEENGSPKLVFGPANDIDQLTSVTMRISPEFAMTDARIKGRAPKGLGGTRDEINDEINDEIKLTVDEVQLVEALSRRPEATYVQLAEMLACSEAKVYRLAKSLRDKGVVERVGSRKSGKWVVHQILSSQPEEHAEARQKHGLI